MGWRENMFGPRPPNPSEEFVRTLHQTPLNAHIESLHALLLHLDAEGDALAVGEHHLRLIAAFVSAWQPRRPWDHPATHITPKENPS